MIEWWWSWLLTAIGVTGIYLTTRRLWYGFLVGLCAQGLWVTYALVTDQLGFLASAAAYGSVNALGLYKWTRSNGDNPGTQLQEEAGHDPGGAVQPR